VQYIFIAWTAAAAILLIAMAAAGRISSGSYLGILRDSRGRYSLSRFQVLLWTTVVLSLLAAVFLARLIDGTISNALDIQIPQTVLLVLGISVGSTVTAGAIKAGKDNQDQTSIAASTGRDPARFSQVVLVEEGKMADRAVDVTKFQSLWITLILVTAYVAMAVSWIRGANSATELGVLPDLTGALVTLLAISHAGYLAGKLPDRVGVPDGALLLDLTDPQRAEAMREQGKLKSLIPRNKAARTGQADSMAEPVSPASVRP
jgi:hypothetical protein